MTKPYNMQMSVEYVRGNTHRHHNCDYHPIKMKHSEPYHLNISNTIYERMSIDQSTKIGQLATDILKVSESASKYDIAYGPLSAGIIRYLVHNKENGHTYRTEIHMDGKFACSCPRATNDKHGRPCKHVLFVALAKGHNITLR